MQSELLRTVQPTVRGGKCSLRTAKAVSPKAQGVTKAPNTFIKMAKIIKSIPLLLTRCHCRNELIAHSEPNGVVFSDRGLHLGLDCARSQCRSSPVVIPSLSIRTLTPRAISKKVDNFSLTSVTNLEFDVSLPRV